MGAGESPLVCKKKQRRKHRLGAVAQRIAVLRTGWAHTSQKFAWATSVLRQFRTLSAKQKISSLLFMLKSKEEIFCFAEKVLNGRTTNLVQEIFCANALYICRFRLVGKGLERETLLPFPRLRRFGTHSETGSKFLLLFSIKSKEESPCFAEKVLNGRTANVAQAKLLRDCAIFSLARMRPFKLPSSSTLSAFSANPPTAPSLAPHPPAAQPQADA